MVMKGYLVIDDVSLDEAKKLMKKMKKLGRWFSQSAMSKNDTAVVFAMTTHGFAKIEKDEMYEFKKEVK
jgi:hypothetical protein